LPIPTTPEEEEQAKKWFSENVKVYVVSLPRDQNRSDLVSARLQALGIQATRLDGVDMNESGMLDEAKGEGWIRRPSASLQHRKLPTNRGSRRAVCLAPSATPPCTSRHKTR